MVGAVGGAGAAMGGAGMGGAAASGAAGAGRAPAGGAVASAGHANHSSPAQGSSHHSESNTRVTVSAKAHEACHADNTGSESKVNALGQDKAELNKMDELVGALIMAMALQQQDKDSNRTPSPFGPPP